MQPLSVPQHPPQTCQVGDGAVILIMWHADLLITRIVSHVWWLLLVCTASAGTGFRPVKLSRSASLNMIVGLYSA